MTVRESSFTRAGHAAAAASIVMLAACAMPTGPMPPPAQVDTPEVKPESIIARSESFIIYAPEDGDTLASLARRFLGTEERSFEIADFNGITRIERGHVVVIPLRPVNPRGVTTTGYQTIPILTYHRVGPRLNRMIVAPDAFEAQLDYLKRNDYRVIRLADLPDFLEGRRPLPKRAVAITFDDGHVSSYQYAFPLLKKYGFHATYYLYTDFLGARDALNWAQIREMSESGLIDFQAHSKTHSNLMLKGAEESEQRYRDRLDVEIRQPRDLIQRNLPTRVTQYAYPYGDANEAVLERITQAGNYKLGLTVNPGGNAFFAHPLMLRRTMVFGEHDLAAFKAALQVFREANLK
jgi:peptidoglycan/xylan/chitin deacetylase (PgdA/CDA1 family)